MPRGSYINVSSTWKKAVNIWLNVGGVWKQTVKSFIYIGSDWKRCIDYAPAAPTGLNVDLLSSVFEATWNSVTDADGYQLERKPQWNGSSWIDSWKQVYAGANAYASDAIMSEHEPDPSQQFDFRVRAYTGSEFGSYSSIDTLYWYP